VARSPGNWIVECVAVGSPRLRIVAGGAPGELGVAESESCTVAVGGGPGAAEVLAAYSTAGSDTFARLRGPFALAVADRERGLVSVVRDAAGHQPLFHATSRDGVLVSPDAGALAGGANKEPRPDRLAAAAFLCRMPLSDTRTMFDGVERVLQGHLLEGRNGRFDSRRYWRPASDGEQLEPLLRRAVLDASAGGRLGVLLSGGLDSALIAAVAADVSEEAGLPTPIALSIAFRGSDANEEELQREVARRLGFELVLETPAELVRGSSLTEAAFAAARGGTAHPPELLTAVYEALVSRGAELGCDAILSGAGGDEWLMPPPGYAADRLAAFDVPALVELVRASAGYWPDERRLGAMRSVLWETGGRPLLRSLLAAGASRAAPGIYAGARLRRAETRLPSWLVPDRELRLLLAQALVERTRAAKPGTLAEQDRRLVLDSGAISRGQERNRELEQRVGVRLATPLLDPGVVAHLYGRPERDLVAGGYAKALAREIVQRRLGHLAERWPRTVYGNRFWLQTLRSEGAAAWSSLGGITAVGSLGLADNAAVARILQGDVLRLGQLSAAWRAMVLESWLQREFAPILSPG
jgi:asparagine synthetase B (glutamine-hydrolysing)